MVPTTLYYAGHELTSGGVWRSLDGGVTWTHQLGGQVGPLAIDPATPSTVYAGTFFSGVWKSTDGGSTWVQADSGLDPEQIGALAIDPQLPTRLYAGLLGGEGLFRSDNAAVSWAPANHGLFAAPVRGLKADPVTPSTVYAMVAKDWDKPIGLTRSNDMGATWTRLLLAPFDLAINPISPSTMYAAATFGVYRTTDGGTTWLPVNNGISLSTARSVAIDPLTPSTVYAATSDAIYRSTNGGDSWTNSSAGLPAGAFQSRSVRLVIDPQTPSTLYLSGAAVYRTVNGGDSWTEVSNGLAGVFPSALAINPLTPSTLYLGTVFDGVFRTTNGGGTWTPVGAGLPTAYITSLALDPSNPSTIYVATAFRILGVPAAGVFRSTDSGMTWTAMSAGLTDLSVGALAIDPLTPSILYAGTDFRSTFRWQPEGVRRLGVIKGGTGSGTVTSTTAGIQCGPDCVQEYPIGALVTLNPVALPPSTFVSFGGDPDCADGVITMADNRTCTAVFNLPSYTLTVTKAGAGSGTVTSSVPGIDCGTDCAEPYTLGTVVTLTALPTTGSAFAGWSGGCSGIAQTCQVTMTQASSVTAAFGVGPPVAFSKGSPFNGQNLFGNIGVPMGWQVAGGADSYEYCIDTINNNSCDGGWIATVTTDARTGALLGATTYYWQVRAFNAAGTTEANSGTWWTFRTPDTGSPQVFTGVATGLGGMAATLNGTANPRGTTATGFFEYGATTTYGSTTAVASLGSGGSSVAIGNGNITGLTCNTVYHFRAGATNLMGTNYGSDVTFTTTPAGCPFTDSELTPGTTLMKAVHIIELRVRIDLLRTRQGLPAFNWTDTSLLAGVTAIRAVHFVELRAALAAVYAAAGRAVPIYTDADLRAGTTAKGVHILEIRSAVVALE